MSKYKYLVETVIYDETLDDAGLAHLLDRESISGWEFVGVNGNQFIYRRKIKDEPLEGRIYYQGPLGRDISVAAQGAISIANAAQAVVDLEVNGWHMMVEPGDSAALVLAKWEKSREGR